MNSDGGMNLFLDPLIRTLFTYEPTCFPSKAVRSYKIWVKTFSNLDEKEMKDKKKEIWMMGVGKN